jgi:uncharacterized RmlC-like cupin family protein
MSISKVSQEEFPAWKAVSLSDSSREVGPQNQHLVTSIACGGRISSGWAVMPPGHMAVPHVHRQHDIIVSVIEGHVMSLVGYELRMVPHGPGDCILIAAGVPHCGINSSTSHRVVLHECRTDPAFNEDVEVVPELAVWAHEIGLAHQATFTRPSQGQSVLEIL